MAPVSSSAQILQRPIGRAVALREGRAAEWGDTNGDARGERLARVHGVVEMMHDTDLGEEVVFEVCALSEENTDLPRDALGVWQHWSRREGRQSQTGEECPLRRHVRAGHRRRGNIAMRRSLVRAYRVSERRS